MPVHDKLGDLYLTSEDGLASKRYTTTIDNIKTPKAPRGNNQEIEKRQLKIVTDLSQFLAKQDVVAPNRETVGETIKKDGPLFLSRDYNESFQMALQQIKSLGPNTRREDRMAAYSNMAHLGDDFHYTVHTYGRIIISEVYMPPEKKTIKPSKLAGIVGGDKFIVQNILFKFAVDSKGVFGNDEAAIKVAGHDLKALTYLFNGWVSDLYFPMVSLVDYRGYRLVGMTLLPISGSTSLVYGSEDAGKTIFQDPNVHSLLEELSKRLNLCDHPVGGGSCRMPTPIDLEVHEGNDGKYYMLDFSRTLPPQKISQDEKMAYLYKHLRPEFVKQYPRRLCSDAFSPFIRLSEENQKNEKLVAEVRQIHLDIRDATEHLKNVVIPKFVEALKQLPASLGEQIDIVQEIHYYGINVRFLGLVFDLCEKENVSYWRSIVLIEMVTRVLKDKINSLLRMKMKEFRYPGEGIYRREVVEFLNLVVSHTESSEKLWEEIFSALLAKFENEVGSLQKEALLSQIIGIVRRDGLSDARCLIFSRLATLTGIRYSTGLWERLKTGKSELFSYQNPFDETDLKEMKERIQEMNIILHSQGFLMRLKGTLSKDKAESQRLLESSAKYFSRAVSASPNNKISLRNYGDVASFLGNMPLARHLFKRCVEIDAKDTNSLFKYAYFLDTVEEYDEAEEFYLKSIEANIRHSNVHCVYADFLAYERGDLDAAEQFYQLAIATDPTNNAAYNNYAILLSVFRKKYFDAEANFIKANNTERGKETPRRFLNLASFYSRFGGDQMKAQEQFEVYKVMHASSLKISAGKLGFEEKSPEIQEQFMFPEEDSYYDLDDLGYIC